jgi:hypothetical protein
MDLHLEYTCEGFEAKKKNYNSFKVESKQAVNAKNSKKETQKIIPSFLKKKVKGSNFDTLKANENFNILNESDFDADLDKIFDLLDDK